MRVHLVTIVMTEQVFLWSNMTALGTYSFTDNAYIACSTSTWKISVITPPMHLSPRYELMYELHYRVHPQ